MQMYVYTHTVHIALPTPPRNVSISPILSSPTSLLVEWVEPEQLNGRFNTYQVRCGTVVTYSNNITLTTLEVTGLSVLTTYICCVSVRIDYYIHMSPQKCGDATTYLGKKASLYSYSMQRYIFILFPQIHHLPQKMLMLLKQQQCHFN